MAMTQEQFNLLQKGTSEICLLVKVTATEMRGGDVIRLALHSKHVVFNEELYVSAPVKASQFQATSGTEIDNADFQTVLTQTFDRLRIKGGKWQGASVELMIVDFNNPTAGYIERQRGRLGQTKIIGLEASAEFRGLTSQLAQEIGDKTSRLCRYLLGDERCTVNAQNYTVAGKVIAAVNKQKFSISVTRPDGDFYRGRILFTSGANANLAMETQNNVGQVLTLFQPMIGAVEVGDQFFITTGDDKTLATCHRKFNNAVNFGGEPSMPDRETLFHFPD